MASLSCDASTEVIGQVMLSYIDNLEGDVILPLLEKHGLASVEADRWYPLQPWLNVIEELKQAPGFSSSMIAVGMKVAEYAVMPPEMAGVTLGQLLEGWDAHFHANHRNGDVGHIKTERVSDTFYRTIHQHIYPDDLNYGLAYGFARALLPKGGTFKVWYEDIDNRRDTGADETVICVQWE